ncbi:hypothetical protein D3C85_1559470 [compost metagenome]
MFQVGNCRGDFTQHRGDLSTFAASGGLAQVLVKGLFNLRDAGHDGVFQTCQLGRADVGAFLFAGHAAGALKCEQAFDAVVDVFDAHGLFLKAGAGRV